MLLYAAGHEATAIAHALRAHPNTIYADLHAFQQHGLRSVEPVRAQGAVARITAEQRSEILRLAETMGLEAYGSPAAASPAVASPEAEVRFLLREVLLYQRYLWLGAAL